MGKLSKWLPSKMRYSYYFPTFCTTCNLAKMNNEMASSLKVVSKSLDIVYGIVIESLCNDLQQEKYILHVCSYFSSKLITAFVWSSLAILSLPAYICFTFYDVIEFDEAHFVCGYYSSEECDPAPDTYVRIYHTKENVAGLNV